MDIIITKKVWVVDMNIEGSMDREELLTFLNFLSIQRRTGVLMVKNNDDIIGSIFLKNGNMIEVEYMNERGESAFYRLMNNSDFSFIYSDTSVKIDKNITINTETLILNAIKLIDETKGALISTFI
ncbi:MAG: hypothetical protein CBR30_08760 [Dictyoglomus sp. NZ13-RE01]|nr:MAG: hypothetical protein CBR30_08760 [Dictyoglomus sp. NZ13-RE01]